MRRMTSLFLMLLIFSPIAHGQLPVEAVALFKDRAVVRSAQGQEMLRVGQTGKAGVMLVSANTQSAIVRYEGQEYTLRLSDRVASNFSKPEQQTVRISRNPSGHYEMRGTINNTVIDLLVDTGATLVSLSERHALSLGLDYRAGRLGRVQTAQGTTTAYYLTLDEVSIGGIKQLNVEAAVIEGNFPGTVLLGMSFLRNVRSSDDAGVLTLTAKY